VYFSILYSRYRAGVVSREMLALPKSRFAAIGLLEALGVAAGMSAGGNCCRFFLLADSLAVVWIHYDSDCVLCLSSTHSC
jgi:hypothetical protein